jgi:hypothetical protein
MKHFIIRALTGAAIATTVLIQSCSKDPDPIPVEDQENLQEVQVHFIKLDSVGHAYGDTTTMIVDKDGHVTSGNNQLLAEQKYRMLLQLYSNEGLINQEITDEGTEHQFFFQALPETGIQSYYYNDFDADNHGIGLDGQIKTGAGNFDLKVVLRHGLDKSHASAQQWNSTNYQAAGGADDLNFSLPIALQ